MLRTLSRLFMIAGAICLGWLLYGLISGAEIPSYVIIGVLLFILGVLFKDRGPTKPERGITPPSQRKSKEKHQSWISHDQ